MNLWRFARNLRRKKVLRDRWRGGREWSKSELGCDEIQPSDIQDISSLLNNQICLLELIQMFNKTFNCFKKEIKGDRACL